MISMKKHLLTILLFVLISGTSFSMCLYNWLGVWPEQSTIPVNPVLIVYGTGNWHGTPVEPSSEPMFFLKSANSMIELKTEQVCLGKDDMREYVLRPVQSLESGKTYQLFVKREYRSEVLYDQKAIGEWTVNGSNKVNAPAWLHKPYYLSKWVRYLGCGPEKIVRFGCCFENNYPMLQHIRLKRLKTDKVSEFFLMSDTSHLEIGFYMCSGVCNLNEGEQYAVSFALMNLAGEETPWTKPIQFIAPTNSDSVGFEEEHETCDCAKTKKQRANELFIRLILLSVTSVVITLIGMFIIRRWIRHRRIHTTKQKR